MFVSKGNLGIFLIQFQTPVSVTLYLQSPRLLKMSSTAAYEWSSSTDLHLWFKCQESSPILKCTVVIRLSDLLIWSQEQAWCGCTSLRPLPLHHPAATAMEEGCWGKPGPVAELILPIRTLCTKALKQPPLWHDDNVQFHTAFWRLTVYYVCKIFLKMVILESLTTVQFVVWENPSKSILL